MQSIRVGMAKPVVPYVKGNVASKRLSKKVMIVQPWSVWQEIKALDQLSLTSLA